MQSNTPTQSWTVPEALAVAYREFTQRFGADLLHQAFEALTLHGTHTMQVHHALDADMGNYLSSVLDARGAGLTEWLANARADRTQDAMLLDIAVRWWRARDDLAREPAGTLVPCTYEPGATGLHSGHQLLSQMLYRASAPDTAPHSTAPVRGTRQ